MTAYLIKSAICMAIMLFAYYLLLEREKMHRFNRFFLLLGLVFSLAVPVISIPVAQGVVKLPAVISKEVISTPIQPVVHLAPAPEKTEAYASQSEAFNISDYLLAIYLLVATALLIRFVINLYRIASTVSKNGKQRIDGVTIVLVTEPTIPYSFMRYIFVNRDEYQNGLIPENLLKHELTHVRQHHSLDIMLIELLGVILWFNPLIIAYKKAIQLNHEFLADEGVIANSNNIKSYQHLLLSKAGFSTAINLTSSFNYSITKKRLIMMTKTTSRFKACIKATGVLPAMLLAVAIFCLKPYTVAANNPTTRIDTVPQKAGVVSFPKPKSKGPYVSVTDKNGKAVFYKYVADFNEEDKKKFRFPKPGSFYKPVKQSPNQKQMHSWTTKSIYGIWIDGKHVKNDTLANFSNTDIVYYTSSSLSRNAINYPKNYFQIDLYTESGYNATFKNWKDRKSK